MSVEQKMINALHVIRTQNNFNEWHDFLLYSFFLDFYDGTDQFSKASINQKKISK